MLNTFVDGLVPRQEVRLPDLSFLQAIGASTLLQWRRRRPAIRRGLARG
jgi:hypothetical protein